MSRSTPLNRLSNKNSSGEKNQLVDEILKELENTQMLQTPQQAPQQAPQVSEPVPMDTSGLSVLEGFIDNEVLFIEVANILPFLS